MARFSVAVAGTGFIGPVHVEALRRIGVNVVGILGSTPQKSKEAAESLGLDIGYESFQQLLDDSHVDAVHITTPNRFHFEMAGSALRSGKHVMCEKPLAMSSAESSELVRIARDSGRAAGVTYNIRFYPLCQEAAQRVRDGRLGDIYHVTGGYVQDWLLHDTDFNWRVLADEGGELRAIGDIGTHWLDLISCITGLEVEAVCADLQTVLPVRQRPSGSVETFSGKETPPAVTEPVEINTEDAGTVLLRFRGGAHGTLHVSQVTAGRKNCLRWEIAGSKQAIAWNSESPNEMWIGHRDKPNEMLIRDPALLGETASLLSNYPGGHNEGFPDTFKQCFQAFYDYITDGDYSSQPLFATFADGHREILLCEAILESHQQQRWVEVEGNEK